MTEYQLKINDKINLSDYSNIHDYMEFINKDDKFTIVMENGDKKNVDIICNMLENNKFQIKQRYVDKNGKCNIKALKMNR
ncbi:hypothetical protein BJV85_000707 [Clostridium acetobutylicum]|uniref:Uncharacterized protein n=1 Tax=Clostridium acetobutylicum (strain ATCC 824 / DSM 792 / JCM 1419 / IAM 19013 / LMG 5710 / NBRC 13948 / NRRL B-527 / VKM B-1787 / 2291 / W) TaxID=272562 RepID=Q97EC0_CLOAB|nr:MULTISPECIES: hypothetical protein [Clostridium]AAK81130.1 Hypothetical protein CA_C3193 [Clostridium acetobutylicum ATCC 824]ADZ22234.1 Conserved hypothetical protein [Clostridium acetobutylicum EA 2018]AEI32706.1 hypothetical protein SMB_G3229 [Clostridium acetobutylicum DSM 1731]AWV82106.1 hypothetical protein DK921_18910 [Clostridium acetobutylicum]AWV82155.1 hypothetical protein DK921_19220 [Clostridium acetobutylicum]